MREILFRGKRQDNGEWIEGNLATQYQQNSKGEFISEIESMWIAPHKKLPLMARKVIPETVGQYTGLTDKNGQKIFEGDILSTENGTFSNTGMGHILLYRGMWTSFYGQDALGRDCFDELHTVCSAREIIGNIHDNPELLEGE